MHLYGFIICIITLLHCTYAIPQRVQGRHIRPAQYEDRNKCEGTGRCPVRSYDEETEKMKDDSPVLTRDDWPVQPSEGRPGIGADYKPPPVDKTVAFRDEYNPKGMGVGDYKSDQFQPSRDDYDKKDDRDTYNPKPISREDNNPKPGRTSVSETYNPKPASREDYDLKPVSGGIQGGSYDTKPIRSGSERQPKPDDDDYKPENRDVYNPKPVRHSGPIRSSSGVGSEIKPGGEIYTAEDRDTYNPKPVRDSGGYDRPGNRDDYNTRPLEETIPIDRGDYNHKPIGGSSNPRPDKRDEYIPKTEEVEPDRRPGRPGHRRVDTGGYGDAKNQDEYNPKPNRPGYNNKPDIGGYGSEKDEEDFIPKPARPGRPDVGGYEGPKDDSEYNPRPVRPGYPNRPVRPEYPNRKDHGDYDSSKDGMGSDREIRPEYPYRPDTGGSESGKRDYNDYAVKDEILEDYDPVKPLPVIDGNCICVPYYQCRDGHIVTDGTGIIDARKRPDPNDELPLDGKFHPPSCGPFHVCCNTPETSTVKPYEHRCGVRNPSGINSRILSPSNKGEADFGEWPWQAAVLKAEGKINIFQCGGVLIDKYHVLTVAHCVFHLYKYNEYPLKVRLGEWDTQTTKEFLAHEDYKVAKIIVHPEYKNTSLWNDVAILKLEEPVLFAPHIDTVCLPQYDEIFSGQNCVVTGWGKDAYKGGTFSNVMKEVALPVVDNYKCEEMLRKTRLGRFFQLHEGFLCAGGEHGLDSCKGDGGGPLVCYRKDKSYALAGIVSWGIDCGQPGVPGVYVKIQKYLDFISKNTGINLEEYWPKY